eukprot:1158843-Pelagomonas_calceolata.AAC.19
MDQQGLHHASWFSQTPLNSMDQLSLLFCFDGGARGCKACPVPRVRRANMKVRKRGPSFAFCWSGPCLTCARLRHTSGCTHMKPDVCQTTACERQPLSARPV